MTTFLLIHGAYQGGFIWKPVATRLRAAGHLVFAPSLDGCGERSDQLRPGITTETQAEELAKFLYSEDLQNVVVVGTSAGGMVMAALAERARPRIARLVFADALALLPGERIRDIVTRPAAIVTDVGTGPKRDDTYAKMAKEDVEPQASPPGRRALRPAPDRLLHAAGRAAEPSGTSRGTSTSSTARRRSTRARRTSAAAPTS